MITIADIAAQLPGARVQGDGAQLITELKRLDETDLTSSSLLWCSDKNVAKLRMVSTGAVICSQTAYDQTALPSVNYILVENPRLAFQVVAEKFFQEAAIEPGVAHTAQIHPSVKIGKAVSIGHNVVIEKDCVIGDFSSIGPNTVLYRRTIIGDGVKIGANNTIGGVGFGYERDPSGVPKLIPHLGNVVIRSHVEIGNNSAIDRAVLGSTLIEEYVKIDNLVHVAHGVKVRRGAFLIANSLVGGSTEVGAETWVAPSATLINGITVGEKAIIGMGAVVLKSVPANATIVGNPGKELQKGRV